MARPSHRVLSLFGPPARGARDAEGRGDGHSEGPKPWTPSQLLGELGFHVERFHADKKLQRIDVIGEVSDPKRRQTGHLHFALKDKGGKLPCILYASALQRVRFDVEDGLEVVASGRIKLYRPKSEVQLVVERLAPVGQGSLALAFEQLKQRLEQEGLFDPARKRPLPRLPRAVGVVTSRDAAALRDVVKVLRGRMPGIPIVVAPARVQGEGAARDIAAALRRLDASGRCDVIVLTRGGGSLEDLWAFNEPEVAHAIFSSTTPVVSGVGHETDTTIADLVADARAATPSHAAALVVPEQRALEQRLEQALRRLRARTSARLNEAQLGLERARRALGDPRLALFPARRRLEALERRLLEAGRCEARAHGERLEALAERLGRVSPARVLDDKRRRLDALMPRLEEGMRRRRDEAGRALSLSAARLHALSPLAVLERGYSLVRRADDGRLVRKARELTRGERVEIRFFDGSVRAQVDTASPIGDESGPEVESPGEE